MLKLLGPLQLARWVKVPQSTSKYLEVPQICPQKVNGKTIPRNIWKQFFKGHLNFWTSMGPKICSSILGRLDCRQLNMFWKLPKLFLSLSARERNESDVCNTLFPLQFFSFLFHGAAPQQLLPPATSFVRINSGESGWRQGGVWKFRDFFPFSLNSSFLCKFSYFTFPLSSFLSLQSVRLEEWTEPWERSSWSWGSQVVTSHKLSQVTSHKLWGSISDEWQAGISRRVAASSWSRN